MSEKQPMYILPENTSRIIGKDAQRNNILAAKIIAEIVKTTLGPKGMDKMLVDSTGNITITNDGVTILEEMEVEHPAAKMMVEIAKTQESEVGDGTTTVALLAGKLLENAEKLLDKNVHPTVIIKGYRIAAEKALQILEEIASPLQDRIILEQIAQTAMTGKGAEGYKEHLANLIVKAIDQVASGRIIDIGDIKIEKIRGESIADSELVHGIVMAKERANIDMPASIDNAKILLLNLPLEMKNPEIETRVSITSPEQLDSFIRAEESYLKNITDNIISSGANVVFCQKGIDDVAQYYLAKAGIFACRRIPRSDLEKLAKASRGRIISNFSDVREEYFGIAEVVEEVKMGNESMIYVRGCKNPKAVTIVLRGGTEHVLDEVERAVKDGLGDAISAVKSSRIVAGGGAVEIEAARRLRIFARTQGGRVQLAIEQFAESLESIPEALAENAGLDPLEILTELKKRHEAGLYNHGLNLFIDQIGDTFNAGIIEPLNVKTQAIKAASEVATLILRIDDVLVSSEQSDMGKMTKRPSIDSEE